MLCSLCTPVFNRLEDLQLTLPLRLRAARLEPPVELAIVDYGGDEPVGRYLEAVDLPEGVSLRFRRYDGSGYYRQAHAYNLAVGLSTGEIVTVMGADTYPFPLFFGEARRRLREAGWLEDDRYKGVVTLRRVDFMAAGGYDEGFEFYGPEDRELAERLERRGLRKDSWSGFIGLFETPDEKKTAGYRIQGTKHQLSRLMRPVLEQSRREGWLVANQGREWGAWN